MNIMNKIYNDKEFMQSASSILSHKEFIKTKQIVHHGSTRFSHSVKVGYLSYKVSKVLGFDTESAIRAGTLHDFFLIRDDENIATSSKMLIKHPSMAKENAINYFGVNEKEQNIIESHMFPISNVAPKYKEAWVVTFCDKIVALMEGASRAKAQVSLWMLFLINFVR